MLFLKLFPITLIVFIFLDLFWVGFLAKDLYKEHLSYLLAPKLNWTPIILFYCLYTIGLLVFAVIPALKESSPILAVLYAGLIGLIGYGTYDLINYATIKDWPLILVYYDLAWGVFISSLTALITYGVANQWKTYF